MRKESNQTNILSILKSPIARLSFSLFFGMIVNFIYIAGNLFAALNHKSLWSATLTVYHSLFLTLRFYLLSSSRRCKDDRQISQVCLRAGILLLFLDLVASIMMIYTIRRGSAVSYSGGVLLGFVIYTAYALSSSILGMKRHANDNQPLQFAARNMTLAAALMSVFNLQYSLLVSVGASSYIIDRIIALSGFSIFFVIILLAIRLVVKNLSGSRM